MTTLGYILVGSLSTTLLNPLGDLISCGWEGKIEVLTNLEAQWMTPRCLGHFDENADASESDSTDGSCRPLSLRVLCASVFMPGSRINTHKSQEWYTDI